MHTRNCKRVHDYLNKDQYDMAKLTLMLEEEFGEQILVDSTAQLEEYFDNTQI